MDWWRMESDGGNSNAKKCSQRFWSQKFWRGAHENMAAPGSKNSKWCFASTYTSNAQVTGLWLAFVVFGLAYIHSVTQKCDGRSLWIFLITFLADFQADITDVINWRITYGLQPKSPTQETGTNLNRDASRFGLHSKPWIKDALSSLSCTVPV